MNSSLQRVESLVLALGIEPQSFFSFVEWALSYQLVAAMSVDTSRGDQYFLASNGLRLFRDDLERLTRREWSPEDLNKLFDAVRVKRSKHYREPVDYGEQLKLLWTVQHKCAKCGKAPPDVMLHIDHIRPMALGGHSTRGNLQLLCRECNLKKSKKLEGGGPWLSLQ